MKIVTISALLISAVAMASLPVMADTCSTGCSVQTKKPSAKKGQFDYTLSCIRDSSGDEAIAKVTAANDKAAQTLALKQC